MSGIIAITSGSERDLLAALTYAGPVAAAVDARSRGFRVSPAHHNLTLVSVVYTNYSSILEAYLTPHTAQVTISTTQC